MKALDVGSALKESWLDESDNGSSQKKNVWSPFYAL